MLDDQHADDVRPAMGPYNWLNARADSYWRDADTFAAEGDEGMAVAYRTISEQLRRCSFLVGTVDDSALAAMEANERMGAALAHIYREAPEWKQRVAEHLADYPFVFGRHSDGLECAYCTTPIEGEAAYINSLPMHPECAHSDGSGST